MSTGKISVNLMNVMQVCGFVFGRSKSCNASTRQDFWLNISNISTCIYSNLMRQNGVTSFITREFLRMFLCITKQMVWCSQKVDSGNGIFLRQRPASFRCGSSRGSYQCDFQLNHAPFPPYAASTKNSQKSEGPSHPIEMK